MTDSLQCLLCEGTDIKRRSGVVAPFLAQRIWKRETLPATLVECHACGFQFFNPRLSDDEERRLYDQYRGPAYQQMRHATEPWYTEKLNASLFSPEAMAGRRADVGAALNAHIPPGTVHTVLDFGGARGELIDGLLPGARGFVYDISRIDPLPGITNVALGSGQAFDLVICSNVFEHVASPRLLLEQILSFCTAGSLVFIEVPNESPLQTKTRMKRLAQLGILTVTHPRLALKLLSVGTTNLMHEHLNFYSPASLRTLLAADPRLQFVAQGSYGETIWILARLNGAGSR